ncbi:MAG: hypothetical protein K2Q01_03565, partial [Rickettsiales bacterium]|nr:hypothetical protein [Rickettsiales bacterium]
MEFGSLFNNDKGETSIAKIGATAAGAGLGGYLGNSIGGTMGMILGGLGGIVGGTFLAQLFGEGKPTNRPFQIPPREAVHQAAAVRSQTSTVATQNYTYDAPNFPGLVRPWRQNNIESLNQFCDDME